MRTDRAMSEASGRAKDWRAVAAVVVGSLALQGCAATQDLVNQLPRIGASPLEAKYLDAADVCASQREPLVRSKDDYTKVIWGAALGALSGAIIGGAAKGGKGAAAGALIGGAAGAAAGYLATLQQNAKNQQELQAAINSDVRDANGEVGKLRTAMRELTSCRQREMQTLERDIRAGRSKGDDARARLGAIRSRIAGDRDLVDDLLGNVADRNDVYVEALAQTRKVDSAIVAGEAKKYQPKVASTSSTKRSAALPTQSSSGRPAAKEPVQGLILATTDTKAETDARYKALDAELEALKALTG